MAPFLPLRVFSHVVPAIGERVVLIRFREAESEHAGAAFPSAVAVTRVQTCISVPGESQPCGVRARPRCNTGAQRCPIRAGGSCGPGRGQG